MSRIGHAFVAVAALLLSSPAISASTTVTQSFYVDYAEHGSSGSRPLLQYDGPLKLKAVTVAWEGYAYSWRYAYPSSQNEDGHFLQYYEGIIGFWMYADQPGSNFGGVYDYKTFSGTSYCNPFTECTVGGSDSGTYKIPGDKLEGFVGDGYFLVDSASYVDPTWYGFEDSGFASGVSGTMIYTLGPVPEPASWAMLVGGFGIMGAALRVRRRSIALTQERIAA